MIEGSKEIVDEVDGFATDQFRNRDMLDGYAGLARELLEQLHGRIDAFCAYVGTSGCFVGITRELRRTLPELHRIAIEPAESSVLSGGEPGAHRIEGGGSGFWPPILERSDFDEVRTVSTEDAQLARELGGGKRVVTPLVDSGLKYLRGDL